MAALAEKKDVIFRAEERFAFDLAKEVMPKPALSVWMILIPVIIVFHMYRHQRVMTGRREFISKYLISRKRALEEAFRAARAGVPPDIAGIVSRAEDLPGSVVPAYESWMRELVGHFSDLLASTGSSYAELVSSAYRTRTEYLIHLNRLNRCERRFNEELKPHLAESSPGVPAVFDTMERAAEQPRRSRAAEIYGAA